MLVNQGDVYWVSLDGHDLVHPHVVIQDNVINHSRVSTVVVCALTTNMKRAKAPGNVRLEAGEANLPRPSVVVVSQVSSVDRSRLGEYIGSLPGQRVDQILAGMRFLQSMADPART
jgi:mRNA interferase MazF